MRTGDIELGPTGIQPVYHRLKSSSHDHLTIISRSQCPRSYSGRHTVTQSLRIDSLVVQGSGRQVEPNQKYANRRRFAVQVLPKLDPCRQRLLHRTQFNITHIRSLGRLPDSKDRSKETQLIVKGVRTLPNETLASAST